MRSTVRPVLSLVVLTSAALALWGCNHETLSPGSQTLAVNYLPSPSGLGRYDRGSFKIQTVQALPIDPATPDIFGPDPNTSALLFRFDNDFTADMASTAPVLYSTIGLAEGDYQITKFRITPPALVDNDVSPTPATCIDGVAVLNKDSAPTGSVPDPIEFVLPPGETFVIRPGQTTLSIKVNVPGLIAGYESAFTCQLGCGPGGAPCLTAFNAAAFRASVLANVSFE